MKIKKVLKIGTLALFGAVLCFFRLESRSGMTNYGEWLPTKDIHLDTVIVKLNADTRQISHIGLGTDVLVASITSEQIDTAPTLYLPIFQFGEAKGTAQVSLSLNGHQEGTTEVSTESQYKMFGLLPSLSTRSSIRKEIDRAITKTVEQRIEDFRKRERARQTWEKTLPK